MENISAAAKSLNTSSFSSRTEGIALCSAFVIEAVLIVFGNVLTIVLFALKKRLPKKSLFLVVNMAFADVILGAVSLPFFVFLVVGLPYQLRSISYDLQLVLDSFYVAFDVIFSQASVMLASHAGVFRGARISSLPTNACSTEDNIPLPLSHSRGK